MRRFLFILTILSVPGWSQPAQQPAQPPIVVKVEMPPTNPWVHLVEIVVPGIIGAGLALFGVWLTNRNNAATNAANRQHALDIEKIKDEIAAQAKSRDNRWEFLKNVYVGLIEDTTDLIRFYSTIKQATKDAGLLTAELEAERLEQYRTLKDAFMRHRYLANLTLATEAITAIEEVETDLFPSADPLSPADLPNKLDAYISLRGRLCDAGRKDLWGTPEDEAQVQSTK
jgi:hypothetical protein